jgi:hypothetical protein
MTHLPINQGNERWFQILECFTSLSKSREDWLTLTHTRIFVLLKQPDAMTSSKCPKWIQISIISKIRCHYLDTFLTISGGRGVHWLTHAPQLWCAPSFNNRKTVLLYQILMKVYLLITNASTRNIIWLGNIPPGDSTRPKSICNQAFAEGTRCPLDRCLRTAFLDRIL